MCKVSKGKNNKYSKIYKHHTWRLFHPKYAFTWLLFVILWCLGQLSHTTAIKVGNTFGSILYKLFPKRKYIVETNLKLCFPNKSAKEINILTKRHFQSLVIGAIETVIAWYGPESTLDKLASKIEIENEHILKEYLNKEEPLILITPHAVDQELLSKYLARSYKYAPVFRHMNNPVANYLMQKARLKIYNYLILKADIRSIVRTIKENKIPVGILPDQDFGRRRSVFVPFFGVPAATTTSLSKYKKLTNANMLVLSYHREFDEKTGAFKKFVININPPLDITGTHLEKDAREFNQCLENIIKKDITMYFWVAKKFKTRPEGEPKIYNYKSKNIFKSIQKLFPRYSFKK